MGTTTTTRSSISRLLRAAASHQTPLLPSNLRHFSLTSRSVHTRATTTLLLPHHHTSPSTFLHPPYPSNLHYFSKSLRVHTRATAVQNPSSIWPYALTFGCKSATRAATSSFLHSHYSSATTPRKITVEASKASFDERDLRLEASFPNLFRKGHSVVVEVFARTIEDTTYFSVTEVSTKPEEISAAMERNKKIISEKLKVDRYTTSSKASSKSAADPLKSKSEALTPEVVFIITEKFMEIFLQLECFPDFLREGDSVFFRWFGKPITDEFKEGTLYEVSKFSEVLQEKLGESKEDKSAKSMTFKGGCDNIYHFSVEVCANHDEKYMPQDVATVIIPG